MGNLFKKAQNLENHLENSKKDAIYHKLFLENIISFEMEYKKKTQQKTEGGKSYERSNFGKILISKRSKVLFKNRLSIDF